MLIISPKYLKRHAYVPQKGGNMKSNQKNIELCTEKKELKNRAFFKYLSASPLLSWVLVIVVFTISFADTAGTRPS